MLFIFSRDKRLWYIVSFAFLIAVILITVSFYLVMNKKGATKKNFKNTEIFDTLCYECEYNMQIFSNKNQNSYDVEEKYLSNDGLDNLLFNIKMENQNITYISTPNKVEIKSDLQISKFFTQEYQNSTINLNSVSTFIFLRNHIVCKEKEFEKCVFSENIQDDTILYKITLDKDCIYYSEKIGKNLNITSMELIVDRNTNLPKEYIIYGEDEKAYIDINYKNFEINSNFDMKVFDF